MLALALSLFGWGRKVTTGPFGSAIVVVATVLGLLVAGSVYFKIHDHIVAREATRICEDNERADRLAKENAAIAKARDEARRALAQRTLSLAESDERIGTLNDELEALRDALSRSEAARAVVFPADDPWLRQARPGDKGGPGGRGGRPDPVQPRR